MRQEADVRVVVFRSGRRGLSLAVWFSMCSWPVDDAMASGMLATNC